MFNMSTKHGNHIKHSDIMPKMIMEKNDTILFDVLGM